MLSSDLSSQQFSGRYEWGPGGGGVGEKGENQVTVTGDSHKK